MKKLFFTAIAVVAFSSASMANTIADEEEVSIDNKNVSTVVDGGCDHLFEVVFWWSYQRTGNVTASNSMAFAAYDKCLGCDAKCDD